MIKNKLWNWTYATIGDMKSLDPNTTYIVSYPRCGVTWLRFLIMKAFGKEDQRMVAAREDPNLPNIYRTHDTSEVIRRSGNRPNPYRLFAYDGRKKYRNSNVILLIREPKDCIVSNYHHIAKRIGIDDMSEYIRDPLYGFKRLLRFYNIWDKNLSTPEKLIIITYEDLKNKGPSTMKKILQFINYPLEDKKIENVYYSLTAEKMLKRKKEGNIDPIVIRKGKIGSNKKELKKEDKKFCDELLKETKNSLLNKYYS